QEETCAAFLTGFQEYGALDMGEIWALRPALQYEILNRLETTDSGWPELITSLRHIGETTWRDLFESVSVVDHILRRAPVKAYTRMDFESRDRYRSAVGALAYNSPRTEIEVAEIAIELTESVSGERSDRATIRRRHVGYYLMDNGLPELTSRIEYRAP